LEAFRGKNVIGKGAKPATHYNEKGRKKEKEIKLKIGGLGKAWRIQRGVGKGVKGFHCPK